MAFRVLLHPAVVKTLSRLPRADRQRIKQTLRRLEDDPITKRAGADVKRLTGTRGREDLFRLRVGTYRAVYSVRGGDILVTDLFARGRAYEV